MKKLLILLLVMVASGCAPYWYIPIEPPQRPAVVVAPTQPPAVVRPIEPQSEDKVWRPDPTKILICNMSKTVTIDKLWIDSRPPKPPTIEKIWPETCDDVYVFLGDHYWYAEGSTELPAFGKTSVGTGRGDFYIRNWSSWGGGYAQRVYIYDGSFNR